MSSLDKALLKIVLPTEEDYARMVALECKAIHFNDSYAQFIEWNILVLRAQSVEELVFFRHLCNTIMRGDLFQMDMEDCVVFKTCSMFFDVHKKIVVVHPR
jgi:hypothetical protein